MTWPVRWRLALASASLTLAILLVFGGVIGHFAGKRVHDDFNRELRGAVRTLAGELVISVNPITGQARVVRGPDLNDYALANDASVRIFNSSGALIKQSRGAGSLSIPTQTGLRDEGPLRIATSAVTVHDSVAGFVEYGRSRSEVDSTIERLWLFIVAGVLGGTLLATLAGLAIADRAMRPIASLTATAREIATTGDPSREVPQPATSDEVAELAQTLQDMLRALDSAQAEREAALDRQREFVADASHELRTPLTSVLANLELLQEHLKADRGEETEIVESALRSSRRMSRLVSDLLLLARADAGRTGTHRPSDLAEITRSAAGEVAAVAGDRTVRIHASDPMTVNGNPDELHRLALNLLENAVRHTPSDASVDVSLTRDDGEGTVVLDVADDGPGVPEELREQVFSRFVRGFGPADTAGGSGTGLGLAIVSSVAASHGGRVAALEAPEGGALFRVTLPHSGSQKPITESLESL